MENKNEGFPERYHVIDLHVIDHVVGAGLFLARTLQHLRWEPRMSSSEHYEPVQAPQMTRMAQIPLNFDGEGREVE